MTPGERLALDDAEQEVMQITQAQDDNQSTGIRRPPTIEETETTLEAATIGFEFSGQPSATAEPGASTPPPGTGACCVGDTCTVTTHEGCTAMSGNYRGDGTDCTPNPCPKCCVFVISAHGEGLDDGIPFSCTLPETIIAFPCCTENISSFSINVDCDDTGNPPGAMTVIGNVAFSVDHWELELLVGAFGSITDTLNIGAGCVGGPLEISGEAFPPDPSNSADYTGSLETITVPCGACCEGTLCNEYGEVDCLDIGGTYQGDGTDCTPNPCH